MAREGLWVVVALVGAALFSEGWASHSSNNPTVTPSPSVTQSISLPNVTSDSGPSAQQVAEQQAAPLSGQSLADAQTAAKAYVGQMATKDPGTTVCLTAQETVGLVISVDRPAGGQAPSGDDRQRACQTHLTGSHVAGAGDASAGTATFDHWAESGRARATIVFVDHTGVDWPVGTTAVKFNQAHGVDSKWQFSCPASGTHCVRVSEYTDATSPDPLCVGAFSCTFRYVGTDSHWVSASVFVNDSTVSGAAQHRKVTCHAMGHVLGLEHDSAGGSCMSSDFTTPDSPWPSTQDLDALLAKYAHENG
jgi:hypothetical protein